MDSGSKTLKDAINEAMRDWVANVTDTAYVLGSALGPHPYPLMVREFQSVIGREARRQMLEQVGRLPDVVIACVGGGSNAIGIFDGFIDDPGVRLIGVEAGGERIAPGRHAARFAGGSMGVLQGTRTFVLQDAGRQHRADALDLRRARLRGRRPGARLAPRAGAHGIRVCHRRRGARRVPGAGALRRASFRRSNRRTPSRTSMAMARTLTRDAVVLVNLSGRGDKDVQSVAEALR